MTDLLQGKLTLDLVTPERRLFSGECDEVRAPGTEGGFGVLPGHTPFLTALGGGVLTYVTAGTEHHYAIAGGFCEIAENRVTVLADYAEPARSIDPTAAAQELQDAQKRYTQALAEDEASERRARSILQRAAARMTAARLR
jgi:F-type H+-transporting ATPase subunit epsilon